MVAGEADVDPVVRVPGGQSRRGLGGVEHDGGVVPQVAEESRDRVEQCAS